MPKIPVNLSLMSSGQIMGRKRKRGSQQQSCFLLFEAIEIEIKGNSSKNSMLFLFFSCEGGSHQEEESPQKKDKSKMKVPVVTEWASAWILYREEETRNWDCFQINFPEKGSNERNKKWTWWPFEKQGEEKGRYFSQMSVEWIRVTEGMNDSVFGRKRERDKRQDTDTRCMDRRTTKLSIMSTVAKANKWRSQ